MRVRPRPRLRILRLVERHRVRRRQPLIRVDRPVARRQGLLVRHHRRRVLRLRVPRQHRAVPLTAGRLTAPLLHATVETAPDRALRVVEQRPHLVDLPPHLLQRLPQLRADRTLPRRVVTLVNLPQVRVRQHVLLRLHLRVTVGPGMPLRPALPPIVQRVQQLRLLLRLRVLQVLGLRVHVLPAPPVPVGRVPVVLVRPAGPPTRRPVHLVRRRRTRVRLLRERVLRVTTHARHAHLLRHGPARHGRVRRRTERPRVRPRHRHVRRPPEALRQPRRTRVDPHRPALPGNPIPAAATALVGLLDDPAHPVRGVNEH